jgi:hypothetical protein
MKYYKKTIYEDKELFGEKINLLSLSQKIGISQPYLIKVFKGELIVTEKQYLKLKSLIEPVKSIFKENQ